MIDAATSAIGRGTPRRAAVMLAAPRAPKKAPVLTPLRAVSSIFLFLVSPALPREATPPKAPAMVSRTEVSSTSLSSTSASKTTTRAARLWMNGFRARSTAGSGIFSTSATFDSPLNISNFSCNNLASAPPAIKLFSSMLSVSSLSSLRFSLTAMLAIAPLATSARPTATAPSTLSGSQASSTSTSMSSAFSTMSSALTPSSNGRIDSRIVSSAMMEFIGPSGTARPGFRASIMVDSVSGLGTSLLGSGTNPRSMAYSASPPATPFATSLPGSWSVPSTCDGSTSVGGGSALDPEDVVGLGPSSPKGSHVLWFLSALSTILGCSDPCTAAMAQHDVVSDLT
mmetsp:Transcript_765/g.1557  ORF Transcript_765/g.1557 Transcript_765/m.1557 type:complete len:341 (-) Transcript_765:608-1630(-)